MLRYLHAPTKPAGLRAFRSLYFCLTLLHLRPWKFSCVSNESSAPSKFFVINSLSNCLWLIVSPHLYVPLWPSNAPPIFPPPPDSVIFPQVEYNSYLPGGVMNGCPLLKCLSITFECSLSLTSEQHTHWAKLHKQAHTRTHARSHSGFYLCAVIHEQSAVFLRRRGIFPHTERFGNSVCMTVGGEEQWGHSDQ